METNYPKRKDLRLDRFDYNKSGAYFLTICTDNRKPILSQITSNNDSDNNAIIHLLPCGLIAEKQIARAKEIYKELSIDSYVIMPDHIHFLLSINKQDGTCSSSDEQHAVIPRFISMFKRFCNKEIGYNIWQRGYFDHIIKNIDDYNEHIKYISENPRKRLLEQLFQENKDKN